VLIPALCAAGGPPPLYSSEDPVIAKHAQEIEPFVVMEVMERAQQLEARGEHLIHLEVGEPDFPTPTCIQEAMARAVKDGMTGYTHSLGILPLREAIAEHYHAKYGVQVSPDRILVTAGTSPAMWMVFAALLEQGDEVILSDPHYACYPNSPGSAAASWPAWAWRKRTAFSSGPRP
jgi:aspartate/methionine/tyrosine aminotransferase